MNVRKSDGSVEEYSVDKIKKGIIEAYVISGEKKENPVIKETVDAVNERVYDGISSQEIRRFVEEELSKRNFNAAKAYILYWSKQEWVNSFVRSKEEFISKYKESANNANTTVDDNSNANGKNIGLLNAEIHKQDNILVSRGMITDKLKELYPNFNANNYIKDLNSHVIYKHDESSFAGAIAPYTYSAKEVIEVKYNGNHYLLPFDLLWNLMQEDEILVDENNVVYQKYPDDLYVRERDNEFVQVTVVTRKKRHRPLVRIKTSFGEDLVVTDNHPMIVNLDDINDTIEASNSVGKKQYKTDDILTFGNINSIDTCVCPDVQEYSSNYCITYSNQVSKRTINVDWNLGYFVGFFVGDGNYNNSTGYINFTQNDRNVLEHLNEILFDSVGVAGKIRYKRDKYNCYTLSTASTVVWWLLSDVFHVEDKAENKTLPINLLEYNEDFSKGLLCGLMDADGTVSGNQLSIRLSSRSCILQVTSLLRHFGYGVGNTIQNLPFSNNSDHYHTNYTIWGVNCSPRESCIDLGDSYKLNKILSHSKDSSLKYKKSGETNILSVSELKENDAFLGLNEFIFDITTESRCFSMNNILVHNCVSISMYPFILNGLKPIGLTSGVPKNLDGYCGAYCNMLFAIASQYAGAVATPEFLLFFDYFCRKEWGDDYYKKSDEIITTSSCVRQYTIKDSIHQHFQGVIHSICCPASSRNAQSPFTNFSYFDKPFFDSMFENFVFPDGTRPIWDSLNWLQKDFMQWFNNERLKTILTFPVESFALIYQDGKFVDEENAQFVADELARGHSFFIYISDTADSLSSCCRLKNKIQTKEFSFTNGNIGVETGSKSVITLNLNRITQDFCKKEFGERPNFVDFTEDNKIDYKKHITKILERVYKYHNAYNELLWDMYDADLLPIYKAGFIDLNKQYLTIGLNGLNQAAEFLGLECSKNEDYRQYCQFMFAIFEEENEKHKTKKTNFNCEQVPAESLGIKNYNWDKEDGYWVPEDTNLYASYVFKPNSNDSILDRLYMMSNHFAMDKMSGGAAAHINLDTHLSSEQYMKLLKYCGEIGCSYHTYNVPNSECRGCGYITKVPITKCPKCGSEHIDYYDRIIGYLTKINNWSEGRQIEQKTRVYSKVSDDEI